MLASPPIHVSVRGTITTWAPVWWLGAAVLSSAATPFWNTHPDEATYLQLALDSRAHGSWATAWLGDQPNFFKPPLLYALMRLSWSMGGDSLFFARLPTLAMLLASAALAASWVGRRAGDRAAVVTALLVLGSPLALRFGHLAMMDVPLGFVCLALARVGEAWRGGLRLPRQFLFTVVLLGAGLNLKGPALAPLLLGSLMLGAGLSGLRAQWKRLTAACVLGGLVGSWWLVFSWREYGERFLASFWGTENAGKFAAPWSITHVLLLALGVVLAGLPFGVWPKTMFHNQAAPLWARAFPPLVLAFYALPSVTFLQYAIVVAPAVAITVGTSAPRLRLRWLWVFAGTVGTGLLVLSFWVQFLHIPTTASCASYQFEGQDKGYFSLELHAPVRSGQGECLLQKGRCDPTDPLLKGRLLIPEQRVPLSSVVQALRQRTGEPLSASYCVLGR